MNVEIQCSDQSPCFCGAVSIFISRENLSILTQKSILKDPYKYYDVFPELLMKYLQCALVKMVQKNFCDAVRVFFLRMWLFGHVTFFGHGMKLCVFSMVLL